MPHEIIPQQLAIRSMRSSGYRDTAHAIAELIDNSIQAGEGVNPRTEIEVLCVDRYRTVNTRKRRQLDEIAVYDNACGMDPKTLRDALQFGNGTRLSPRATRRASASSAWACRTPRSPSAASWKCGAGRTAPVSTPSSTWSRSRRARSKRFRNRRRAIPDRWREIIRDPIGDHGTLVVWTQLDRVTWKGSKALLENSEFLVGAIYRYFIDGGKARIRLAAFEEAEGALRSGSTRTSGPTTRCT